MSEAVLDASIDLGGEVRTVRLAAGGLAVVDDVRVVRALTGDERRPLLGGPRHEVRLDGRRVERLGTAGRVRRGLGIVSGAPVAEAVSVHDHLAAVAGDRRAERILRANPLLGDRGGLPAGVLSGGERLMLAWLRALAGDPVVVVLDRAGTGLAPDALTWAGEQVRRWREEGTGIVLRPGRSEEGLWGYDV